MPVILSRDDERVWLDSATPVPAAIALLRPFPAQRMRAALASLRVNNVRDDDPQLLIPEEA